MIQNNIVRELKEIEWKSVEKTQAALDVWFLGYNLIPANNKRVPWSNGSGGKPTGSTAKLSVSG